MPFIYHPSESVFIYNALPLYSEEIIRKHWYPLIRLSSLRKLKLVSTHYDLANDFGKYAVFGAQ